MAGTHRGWKYDATNARLAAQFNGTEVFDFDANDIEFAKFVSITSEDGIFVGVSGSVQGSLSLASTGACGDKVHIVAPACADWTLTIPANDGSCGQQLATNGSGVTSWAAACSVREHKACIKPVCTDLAYDRVRNAPIYEFNYRQGYGLRSTHKWVGTMADEAPWAMQGGNNDIFSPLNAFGHLTAAFQKLASKVETIEEKVLA
jgi:hypothetical protein